MNKAYWMMIGLIGIIGGFCACDCKTTVEGPHQACVPPQDIQMIHIDFQPAFNDTHKIPYDGIAELAGSAAVERQADHTDSPYYKHPDFYHMKSTETLVMLENFKTIQQATEWTCGLTSILMVMEWFGKREGRTELDLVPYRENDEPGATMLAQMVKVFHALGGWSIYSTFDMENRGEMAENFILDTLKSGCPIIIGWDEWGGHYQVIIGYDTMGTDTTADDVLILADPYDTTDHCQDGYVIESFERLYYNWINTYDTDIKRYAFIVAKPAD